LNTTPSYRFIKKEKLKSRKEIDHLFTKGKSFSHFPLRVVWTAAAADKGLQVGVTVSTRYFKKAVERNRVKRLLRETIRLQKSELQQQLKEYNKGLQVFFIYQSNELPHYHELFDKIGKALLRLQKLLHEPTQ
jgi:ribonuclease P protein component